MCYYVTIYLSLGSISEIAKKDLIKVMVLESERPGSEPQFFTFLGLVPMSKLAGLIKHHSCNWLIDAMCSSADSYERNNPKWIFLLFHPFSI